jgi:DNA-binding MurR/RpiR family transcriptional regulator
MSNPDEVPFQSVQEVSRGANVSVASVSRLARKVGCRSFKDFKIELAQESPSTVSALYEGIRTGDSDAEIVRKVFGANMRSLEETLQMADAEAMQQAARAIAKARRLVFFGIGGSGTVAQEAALRFCHLDVQAEAYADGYQMLVQANRTGKQDVAVAISHSGRSTATVDAVALCRERGAMTIGLCNYPLSPLKDVSDTLLVTSFSETKVKAVGLSSLVAQICLIDTLYLLTARHKKPLPDLDQLNRLTRDKLRMPD